MLRALTIQHFAIVEHAELEFRPGFGVITGETGAGKSILVDALGLLVGGRAEGSWVAQGQDKAELSAHFEPPSESGAHAWLKSNDMAEPDGTVLIRRSIQGSGGSRAWINGQPVSATQLKELGVHLLEIHGQHAHQKLSKPDHQRALLDAQCPAELVQSHQRAFFDWQKASRALDTFNAELGDEAQADLLAFQAQELESLALMPDEYEQLEAEQERLQRFDEIQRAIHTAATLIDQEEGPSARQLLRQIHQAIAPLTSIDPRLGSVATLIEESLIRVAEAALELDHVADESSEDPERLQIVNDRLSTALELARKHRLRPEELPALTQTLKTRLEGMQNQDGHRKDLARAVDVAANHWRSTAEALSKARKLAAQRLTEASVKALRALGMTHAQLLIEVTPINHTGPNAMGLDEVGILFSANPGQPTQALAKVASGGELSRIALAIMLATGARAMPLTRIFDEVDAGIGGETAHAVGAFLRRVAHNAGEHGQALCVTHLAQVAARADQHFQVTKAQTTSTSVDVRDLSPEARITEIARMLGNAKSEKSRAHARELLDTVSSMDTEA